MRLYSTFVFYIHQVSHHKEIPASYKTDFHNSKLLKNILSGHLPNRNFKNPSLSKEVHNMHKGS